MSKTTDTVFQLLAYTGIGIAYAREAELEKRKYISIKYLAKFIRIPSKQRKTSGAF